MAKDKETLTVSSTLTWPETTADAPLRPGYWRVRALRNHDGRDAFYVAGHYYDVHSSYAESQIVGKSADGHTFTVSPPVFEVIKKS